MKGATSSTVVPDRVQVVKTGVLDGTLAPKYSLMCKCELLMKQTPLLVPITTLAPAT